MEWFHHHPSAISAGAAIVQALAAAVIVYLTFRLVRATDTYARLTRESLQLARIQFEREWLPDWYLALVATGGGITQLIVYNLSRNSARVTHLFLRVESEPESRRQFDLDLALPGQHMEQFSKDLTPYIMETIRPFALEHAWHGVLEVAIGFLVSGADEPRPSKSFPFRVAVRDGRVTELRPKMPYIAGDLTE